MQATNGSAVSFGSRTRLIGCCMAVMLALSALAFASTASAAKSKPNDLALGDSLAFGYSQQLFNENEKLGAPPTAFENGYVNDYFATLLGTKTLINDGCPGETTDSMIGNGPLGAAMARALGTTGESPCAYHYTNRATPPNVFFLPLHNEYGGSKSQLENALQEIAAGAAMGKPVRTVTLDIGPNDELHQVKACEAEVKHEFETEFKSKYGGGPEEAVKHCIEVHLPALFKHILTNIAGSLFVIRHGASFGGVNYSEKIVVLGAYNPFGAVFTPGKELLSGSNAIATALNSEEAKLVTKPEFGACYADSLPTFNPQNNEEPTLLQKFTNMANFTEFEGKKNGPDIHPTPLGYQELANVMLAQCG
jgi:hypothetical protein